MTSSLVDTTSRMWEIPTIKTVTSDEKRRIRLGDIGPREVFQVTRPDADRWLLTRLHPPGPPKQMTRAEVKRAMQAHALTMKMTWEKLRAITREP